MECPGGASAANDGSGFATGSMPRAVHARTRSREVARRKFMRGNTRQRYARVHAFLSPVSQPAQIPLAPRDTCASIRAQCVLPCAGSSLCSLWQQLPACPPRDSTAAGSANAAASCAPHAAASVTTKPMARLPATTATRTTAKIITTMAMTTTPRTSARSMPRRMRSHPQSFLPSGSASGSRGCRIPPEEPAWPQPRHLPARRRTREEPAANRTASTDRSL